MKLLNSQNMQFQGPFIQTASEVHKIQIKDKIYLYDTNSMMLWETMPQIAENLDLTSLGSDQKPFCEPYPEPCHKMLVFQVTYACNLACRYCFVKHHYLNHENSLKYQEAIDALNLYQENLQPSNKEPYKISFFGGEPLMNWELIYKVSEEIIKRAKNKGCAYSLHITTNATLVTEEIAEYCASRGFSFIVSLDGEEAMHDNNRPYVQGGGTFKDTMRGLEFLVEAYKKEAQKKKQRFYQPPITLRGTFDKNNVDLVASLKYLNKLMYEGFAGHVSVEPSSLGEGCVTDQVSLEGMKIEEVKALFESQYEKAAAWFLGEIQAGRKPSFHHFEVPLQRLFARQPFFNECGAGKGYLSIGPGGSICACHRENNTAMGNLYQGGIDKIEQANWLDNRFYTRTTCSKCWRRHICGGGCRYNSLLTTHNIHAPAPIECLFHDITIRQVVGLMGQMTQEQKQMYSQNFKEQRFQPEFRTQTQPPGSKKNEPVCPHNCQTHCQFAKELGEVETKQIQEVEGEKDCGCEEKAGKKV